MADMIPVKSSNIRAVGWEPEEESAGDEVWGTLRVEFNNGSTYQYANVPEDEYEALRDAKSVGQHFQANIRPQYDGERV